MLNRKFRASKPPTFDILIVSNNLKTEMKESEYYQISKENDLPLRCPILNYCSRRAWTIYLFSEYYKHDSNSNMVQTL